MPTLDDLLIVPRATTLSGNELIPAYDPDSPNSSKVLAAPLSSIHGLQTTDVASVANGGTISTRLSVVTGTTPTVTLPAVAGNLRKVIVMNTASGDATVDGAGSEQVLTGTANANNVVVATGKSAILLSDGTRWYHISNDA
jgi:hypothetical protein